MICLPEQDVSLHEIMPMIRSCLERGQTVAFRPRGISMLPMLRHGKDQVTLSPVTGKLKKYDLPLYQREDGCFVLHRVLKAGETYTCIVDNQFSYEPGIRPEQIIAVVTAFERDGKTYSVHQWQYKLYCRYWHYTRLLRRGLRKLRSTIRKILP